MPIGDVICFEVAYDSLVRSSVARRRAAARRADQQRDLRPHRRDLPAAGDEPAAGGRARADRRAGGHHRQDRAIIGPDGTILAESGRAVHAGDRSCACRCPSRRPLRWRRGWARGRSTLLTRARASPALAWSACVARGAGTRRAGAAGPAAATETVASDGSSDVRAVLERVLVIIPTYNERDNIEAIVRRLLDARPDRCTCWSSTTAARTAPARSPTRSAEDDPRVHVLHRTGEGRARRGLHRRVRLGAGSGLRRARRDGRRRLARARAAAAAAGGARRTPTWCSARAGCPAGRW